MTTQEQWERIWKPVREYWRDKPIPHSIVALAEPIRNNEWCVHNCLPEGYGIPMCDPYCCDRYQEGARSKEIVRRETIWRENVTDGQFLKLRAEVQNLRDDLAKRKPQATSRFG